MLKDPKQLLKKLTLLAESLNVPEGTASNQLISHEFKSSDLSSYTHLFKNLSNFFFYQRPIRY